MVVEGVLGAHLHREQARVPVVVLGQHLVALGRDGERADVARDVAARLAGGERLEEDRLALLVAHVFHLMRHRREDWGGAGRDFGDAALLAEHRGRGRAGDLELAVDDKVHGVDGVLMRHVLGARRKSHLDEASDILDLSDRLVQVRRCRAALRQETGDGAG